MPCPFPVLLQRNQVLLEIARGLLQSQKHCSAGGSASSCQQLSIRVVRKTNSDQYASDLAHLALEEASDRQLKDVLWQEGRLEWSY